jgi:hypothetical protein
VFESIGVCPDRYTISPASTAWEYGPTDTAPFAVYAFLAIINPPLFLLPLSYYTSIDYLM